MWIKIPIVNLIGPFPLLWYWYYYLTWYHNEIEIRQRSKFHNWFSFEVQTRMTIGPERFWSSQTHKVIVNDTKTSLQVMFERSSVENETSFNWIKLENSNQLIRSHKNISSKYKYMQNGECSSLKTKTNNKQNWLSNIFIISNSRWF